MRRPPWCLSFWQASGSRILAAVDPPHLSLPERRDNSPAGRNRGVPVHGQCYLVELRASFSVRQTPTRLRRRPRNHRLRASDFDGPLARTSKSDALSAFPLTSRLFLTWRCGGRSVQCQQYESLTRTGSGAKRPLREHQTGTPTYFGTWRAITGLRKPLAIWKALPY
jgi:hypothetical protein